MTYSFDANVIENLAMRIYMLLIYGGNGELKKFIESLNFTLSDEEKRRLRAELERKGREVSGKLKKLGLEI